MPITNAPYSQRTFILSTLAPTSLNLFPDDHITCLLLTFHLLLPPRPLKQAPPKQPIHLLQPLPLRLRKAQGNQQHTHQIDGENTKYVWGPILCTPTGQTSVTITLPTEPADAAKLRPRARRFWGNISEP